MHYLVLEMSLMMGVKGGGLDKERIHFPGFNILMYTRLFNFGKLPVIGGKYKLI